MFLSVMKLKLNNKGKINVKKNEKSDKQPRKNSPPEKKKTHIFYTL